MDEHSKPKLDFGFRNVHPLIEERVPPRELIELRHRLVEPRHKDILDVSSKAATFEEALGHIGAMLDIVLDGTYDVPALCAMLCTALDARGSAGSNAAALASGLVSAEIIEREGSLELVEAASMLVPKTRYHLEVEANTHFMLAKGCQQCDQIVLCMANGKCLGDVPTEEAAEKIERLQ